MKLRREVASERSADAAAEDQNAAADVGQELDRFDDVAVGEQLDGRLQVVGRHVECCLHGRLPLRLFAIALEWRAEPRLDLVTEVFLELGIAAETELRDETCHRRRAHAGPLGKPGDALQTRDRIRRKQRSSQAPLGGAQGVQALADQLPNSVVSNRHYISSQTRLFRYVLDKSTVFARNLVSKAMSREERPRIGITTSPRRGAEYYVPYKRAVEAVGAEPVDLPPGTTSLPNVDGLLLPGGWDVDPALYGEKPDPKVGPIDRELDDTELRLFAQARDQNLPVMGICRGQQVINVAMGGSLQQHLDGHEVRQFGRNHLAHAIEVDPRSELGRAAGDKKIRVNSLHHQAIDKLAPGLVQTASGDDGTVEAIETADGLIVAVQCHPEELAADLPWAHKLFERFVERARRH